MRNLSGKKVLIMGYGLNTHGSGPQAAKYCTERGAELIVTDLRTSETLASTMKILQNYPVKWTLGEHRLEDFENIDFLVKNPGIHKSSHFLKKVKNIETDISLFLQEKHPYILAITGSKGKSTVSSLVFHVLQHAQLPSFLAGNISVSPLTYVNTIRNEDFLVLELSSWQIADLAEKNLLHPKISLITNIFPDHQDYYQNNMKEYVKDKMGVFLDQTSQSWSIFNYDNPWTASFIKQTPANIAYFSSTCTYLDKKCMACTYLQNDKIILCIKNKREVIKLNNISTFPENFLMAALALRLIEIPTNIIEESFTSFQGLPNRLQYLGDYSGISYYNDTTATIPLATQKSLYHLSQLGKPIHLLFGGADKELDFSALSILFPLVISWHILEGTALNKISKIFTQYQKTFFGPFSSMDTALESARKKAKEGDIIILSPGCASFGMFKNEFDRGQQFIQCVR